MGKILVQRLVSTFGTAAIAAHVTVAFSFNNPLPLFQEWL